MDAREEIDLGSARRRMSQRLREMRRHERRLRREHADQPQQLAARLTGVVAKVIGNGEQRVLINIELYVPLEYSSPTQDKLHEVVDYDFMRDTVARRMAQGHVHLQETLCDDVLAAMLKHPHVRAARVSTEKPDVYPDCESVGVEVFRIKD